MKNDNNIFQVLVSGTLAAKNNAVTSLTSGTMGVYSADTNLAIDSTNAATTKNIFLMLYPANSTNLIKSQGVIKVGNINSITKKAYAAGEAAKVTITLPAIGSDSNAVIEADEEIGVTFEIESGDLIYHISSIRKFFYILAKSTANLTATALAAAINADPESNANGGFITATASTNVVTVTFANTNENASRTLLGKTVFATCSHEAITLDDNITGSVTTAFSYAQGKGGFIQALEKLAAGWNGETELGHYRVLEVVSEFSSFTPEASLSSNYNQYCINYDVEFAGDRKNNVEVIVAIPTTASSMITAFEAILGALAHSGKTVGF